MSITVVPNLNQPPCKSATKEGCRRKRHTCTATPECTSILDMYVVQNWRI